MWTPKIIMKMCFLDHVKQVSTQLHFDAVLGVLSAGLRNFSQIVARE